MSIVSELKTNIHYRKAMLEHGGKAMSRLGWSLLAVAAAGYVLRTFMDSPGEEAVGPIAGLGLFSVLLIGVGIWLEVAAAGLEGEGSGQ